MSTAFFLPYESQTGRYSVADFRAAGNRTFTTLTVRLARLASNAFLENIDLVVRTIGEFGEDAERVPPAPAPTGVA